MPSFIETLLALNGNGVPPVPDPAAPVPLATVGNLGPLSNDTAAAFAALNPEPVPPAMATAPPLDTAFVNSYAGPAPAAPTIQQPGFLDKLAVALQGFGAGVQGRGPQYIESVREERQRPIREYQRQLEQFNERRTRGVEIATRQQEREHDRTQRAAEMRYEREFNAWLRKTGVRDGEAKARMRQAFDIQKMREAERIADERQAVQEQKQLRLKAADLAAKYRLAGAKQYANELAERDAGLITKVSPGAEKWFSAHVALEQARLNKIAAGTGGGSASTGPVMARLANGQVVPVSVVSEQTGTVMLGGEAVPVAEYIGGRIPASPAAPGQSFTQRSQDARQQDGLGEIFTPRQYGPPAAQASQQPSADEVKAYAKRFKISPQKARLELMGQ